MATKQTLFKCRYSHCKHPDDLRPPDEMEQSRPRFYYHPDCYKEKTTIEKIIDYYMKEIDDRVTVSFLRKVINQIVYNKNIPAEELWFGLKYTHEAGKRINSPLSLHYIVANKKVRYEYEKQCKNKSADIDVSKVKVTNETDFNKHNKKSKGFGDIF